MVEEEFNGEYAMELKKRAASEISFILEEEGVIGYCERVNPENVWFPEVRVIGREIRDRWDDRLKGFLAVVIGRGQRLGMCYLDNHPGFPEKMRLFIDGVTEAPITLPIPVIETRGIGAYMDMRKLTGSERMVLGDPDFAPDYIGLGKWMNGEGCTGFLAVATRLDGSVFVSGPELDLEDLEPETETHSPYGFEHSDRSDSWTVGEEDEMSDRMLEEDSRPQPHGFSGTPVNTRMADDVVRREPLWKRYWPVGAPKMPLESVTGDSEEAPVRRGPYKGTLAELYDKMKTEWRFVEDPLSRQVVEDGNNGVANAERQRAKKERWARDGFRHIDTRHKPPRNHQKHGRRRNVHVKGGPNERADTKRK